MAFFHSFWVIFLKFLVFSRTFWYFLELCNVNAEARSYTNLPSIFVLLFIFSHHSFLKNAIRFLKFFWGVQTTFRNRQNVQKLQSEIIYYSKTKYIIHFFKFKRLFKSGGG